MFETTEREDKLLKIIDDLLHILNIYVISYNHMKDNMLWVLNMEKELQAATLESNAMEILNTEFGRNYQRYNEPKESDNEPKSE